MHQCKEYTDKIYHLHISFLPKKKTISNVSVQLIPSLQARVVSKTRGTWNSFAYTNIITYSDMLDPGHSTFLFLPSIDLLQFLEQAWVLYPFGLYTHKLFVEVKCTQNQWLVMMFILGPGA